MVERRTFKNRLPKPVLDRIAYYAQEGRQLRAVFGPEGCRLLAVAAGKTPVVVTRSGSKEEFSELRGAVLVEWSRMQRRSKIQKRPLGPRASSVF